MTLEPITYHADIAMTGLLADGSNGRRAPGVLIAHESPGLTAHIRERTLTLAAEGYVAFALDLFGIPDLSLEQAREQSGLVRRTPGLMHARARAALQVLETHTNVDAARLGAIGFCLGGAVVLELARHQAPIRCAIGFHPGLARVVGSPDGPIAAKILMMIGDADPIVPMEDRVAFAQSMTASGAVWDLHVFGGVGHSFTNQAIDGYGLPGFAYEARTARRSWAMALDLLREELIGEME